MKRASILAPRFQLLLPGAAALAIACEAGPEDVEPAVELREQALAPGVPVEWDNLVNAEAAGSSLTRSAGSGWTAGAASVQTIESGDGFVEFSTAETDRAKMAGLSFSDANQGYVDIDFAFYLRSNGELEIYEDGNLRGSFGAYGEGDRFRVEVADGQIRYRHNGLVVYTNDTSHFQYPLALDTSLHDAGATITEAGIRSCAAGDTTCMPIETWKNVGFAAAGSTTLKRTVGSGWTAGASSVATIVDGDGFVEFSTAEAGLAKMAGLSHNDANRSYVDIDFAFYLRQNGELEIYEDGNLRGSFGTYGPDDTFRIEVAGGDIRYRHNDAVIHTNTTSAFQYPLELDTSLLDAGATITNPRVHECGEGETDCMPAETWKNVGFATATGTTLTRNLGTDWVAGASSVQAIAGGNGFVEFSTAETDLAKMAGLSFDDATRSYVDIDFAFYLRQGGGLEIYEDGNLRGSFGTYAAGDTFRVEVVDGHIRYRHNGVVVHTNTTSAFDYPLELDTSLYQAGATITNPIVHACGEADCIAPEAWKNVRFATASPGTLTRLPATGTGWYAGASSAQAIEDGDGFVQFGTGELDLAKMAGLSHGDSHQSYDDIDFAFYLRQGGDLEIYEDGNLRGSFGPYATTDVLRIEVAGGQIRYRRNGVVIHSSSTPFEYPLELDTSLYQTGATITGAAIHACAEGDGGCMPAEMWKNVRYTESTPGALRRLAGPGAGWSAGASSVQAIAPIHGSVQFSTAEIDRKKMAGLGLGDAHQGYWDIGFAFYLRDNGQLEIYESGNLRGSFGAYTADNVFRIDMVDGRARYYRDDTLLYESTVTTACPLALDTSFHDVGATITDAILTGAPYPPGADADCLYVRVTEKNAAGAINVRSKPTAGSSPIGTLAYGEEVAVSDVARCTDPTYTGNWYAIDLGGGTIGHVWGGAVACFKQFVEFSLPFACADLSGSVTVAQGNGGGISHGAGTKSYYAFDIGMPTGTPIHPIAGGTVVVVKDDTTVGEACYDGGGEDCKAAANLVTVRHADGTQSIYAHLSSADVTEGQSVTTSTVLGRSGNSGYSSAPHLHVARQQDCSDASGWCQSLPLTFAGGVGVPAKGDEFCP
ncbi:peptidoglycan DD-metalloendopeptidase family protein [Nannocystis radixulma]|uniref:Peptidoglycan DD-metalloendopeptidase family protein n=1 Tax=Nannocystis radixulma TaxID=2995305 RepID=A0ABT5B5S0_9BACT|nr:peptidoglycan DD-metalloendopeptidase family protein [Nannocystis radixulma]MDC0669447.1 peptidoglycan DD-metalloendopeptidase family protein [Nannocystis radixulma]